MNTLMRLQTNGFVSWYSAILPNLQASCLGWHRIGQVDHKSSEAEVGRVRVGRVGVGRTRIRSLGSTVLQVPLLNLELPQSLLWGFYFGGSF